MGITIRHVLRDAASAILPSATVSCLQAVRSRNYQRKFLAREGLLAIGEAFAARHGREVLHGPFKGMKYPAEALAWRHGTPKLLGSYESELHPVIDMVQRGNYDRIIDIGSAEGYYAVGLAMTTSAEVYAFDTEPRERRLCQTMSSINGVKDRVCLNAWCDGATLTKVAVEHSFIISDCEGYETNLFNDEVCHRLSGADLLIETHDSLVPGTSATLIKRFLGSHTVQRIRAVPRRSAEFAELAFLEDKADKAVSEYRDADAEWLFFRAKLHPISEDAVVLAQC